MIDVGGIMNNFIKEAIELTKAQAAVRAMTEEEMLSMIMNMAARLQNIAGAESTVEESSAEDEKPSIVDAKNSIRPKSITCLECGRVMKVITKKHLALHGLDAAAYREKWGLKKGTPLACKELQKVRRAKMKDMKLWEKRAAVREQKAKIDFGSIEDL